MTNNLKKYHNVVLVAGHIDHGKTSLVQRLTNVDTDRLIEEKRRGMTIELGFAPLYGDDGDVISFIDVPGHERLVHTMIAGAAGVDAFLLVIAANEGIKPQTIEHLAICRALGIERGIVALNKIDRADGKTLNQVWNSVQAWLKSEGLGAIPIIPVSAKTGEGLNELQRALFSISVEPAASIDREPRIALDRSFSIPGAGTVVTGTLRDAPVWEQQCFSVFPGGTPVTIRRIQVHGQNVAFAQPGQRVALNLHGVHYRDIQRGHWLAAPDSMSEARTWLAWVNLMEELPFSSGKTRRRMHFHHGTHAGVVDLVPLTRDDPKRFLALVQSPFFLAGRACDRFILRRLSPVRFAGWGDLILPIHEHPRYFIRKRLGILWENWPKMNWTDRWKAWIESAGRRGRQLQEARTWSGLQEPRALRLLEAMEKSQTLIRVMDKPTMRWLGPLSYQALMEEAFQVLTSSIGVDVNSWLQSWTPEDLNLGRALAERWAKQGCIQIKYKRVYPPGTQIMPYDAHDEVSRILEVVEKCGFSGIPLKDLEKTCHKARVNLRDFIEEHRESGQLVILDADGTPFVVSSKMVEEFHRYLSTRSPGSTLTIQDMRSQFHASRRILMGYLALARDRGWLVRYGKEHKIKNPEGEGINTPV